MSKETFWNRMEDVRAAMLAIGEVQHVPMSPYADAKDGAIWFITAQGTDMVDAIQGGAAKASLIVTGSDDLHARIEGNATLSQDRAKLEELGLAKNTIIIFTSDNGGMAASNQYRGINHPRETLNALRQLQSAAAWRQRLELRRRNSSAVDCSLARQNSTGLHFRSARHRNGLLPNSA